MLAHKVNFELSVMSSSENGRVIHQIVLPLTYSDQYHRQNVYRSHADRQDRIPIGVSMYRLWYLCKKVSLSVSCL